ncbi:disease resistance protein RGA4-like [Triticum urartu]|nr:disease resistance protein RGA4-like [Triticum urartu]
MEAAAATAFVGRIAPKLFEFLAANHKLRQNLEHDITCIQREFAFISAAIQQDDDLRWRSGNGDHVQRAWIQVICDLAHAIEDCIDRFMPRVTISNKSRIHQAAHKWKTMKARKEFAEAIGKLRKISEESSKLRTTYGTSTSSASSSSVASEKKDLEMEMDESLSARSPVGMDAQRDELLELIQQEGQQLKVISVVDFDGIGKTLLARHVYESMRQYQARAWVCATEQRRPMEVLIEITQKLGIPTSIDGGGRPSYTCEILRSHLRTKRFFIVIDDVRTEFWHAIKCAFEGLNGRVIVTTAIQSVANACSSSAHGHVYVMRTLTEKYSRRLFYKESLGQNDDREDQLGSEVLKKCDGLPLALVTTARYLQSTDNPTRENWAKLCHNLGAHLETNEMLARMKRVLVHSYTSLVRHDVKTCLLYLGIYPSGHPVRKRSLIRKWLAEGFIQGDYICSALDAAIGNFNELVNRSIIQPTDQGANRNKNSAEVKTYHTHGMMLEFILHMSKCDKFITMLYDQLAAPAPTSKIRWLSLHDASASVTANDLSLVRSLTVFGSAHKSVLDFSKYELLRVLDLEECGNQLEDKHLKEICSNLLLLRYLSLGAAVKALPDEIKKLRFLETLDVRRTQIEILPTEVIKLPCLIHLFGKFKLQQGVGARKILKLQTWFSENSKLETVAGFVADSNNNSQGFEQLMEHMRHLTKVKIWCEQSTNSITDHIASRSNWSHLSEAIKGFIKRSTNLKKAHSLSVNFADGCSQDLLNFSLEKKDSSPSCYLSSLKLHGNNVCSLPPFITMLGSLTKLCLSFPHYQLTRDILAALSRVRCLAYLKLIASQLDKLVIIEGAFESLRHLCIVVEVMTELEVEEGALPLLESFHLLCQDINGFRGTAIQSLRRIKEVTLHDGVSDKTKHEWKEAAKKHPRHPKLLFVKTAEDIHMGSEPADNSESPAAPTTDTTLSVTVLHDATSTVQSVQVDGDDLQNYDDEKEDTEDIDIIDDFGSKTCLDPLINKENLEQEREGEVGLKDQQIEDVLRSTHQADQNVVLFVMSENTRKRARLDIGEDNLMDKVVDRVKRKNPEDVQETKPTKQTAPGHAVVISDGN